MDREPEEPNEQLPADAVLVLGNRSFKSVDTGSIPVAGTDI